MIIAIETATETCSAALVHQGKVLAERSVNERNVHSEKLLLLIDDVIRSSGSTKEQISAVAVSIGPGSFTGLRIGLSAAKGLALALNLPILAVPTLDGLAEAYRRQFHNAIPTTYCAMIDAKRDEAFFAMYTVTRESIRKDSEYAITLKSDIVTIANEKHAAVEQPNISSAAVGLLAERSRQEFLISDFSELEPMYLRDFVATIPKNKA